MPDKEIRDAFITFKDENEQIVSGWFKLIEQKDAYIKFKTNKGNILTISYSRLIKIKERGDEANNDRH